jgi:6-pyruvoyltetrahydropterin/6-carboxytetrahydropterin synthase
MDFMFDHTYIIALDDPFIYKALEMHNEGIVQLRTVPATGAEQFAKYIYDKVSEFILEETNNRVRVVSVEFKEHAKNSAIYGE